MYCTLVLGGTTEFCTSEEAECVFSMLESSFNEVIRRLHRNIHNATIL